MEIRDYIIIGGVVVGFLILIYGIVALRKMKAENSSIEDVKKTDSTLETNVTEFFENTSENDSSDVSLKEEVKDDPSISISPEAPAADLFKVSDSTPVSEETKVSDSTPVSEETTDKVLNDEVKLNNSSLDSDIVSKSSLEASKDFLETKDVNAQNNEKIESVQISEIPSESKDDNNDIENLF